MELHVVPVAVVPSIVGPGVILEIHFRPKKRRQLLGVVIKVIPENVTFPGLGALKDLLRIVYPRSEALSFFPGLGRVGLDVVGWQGLEVDQGKTAELLSAVLATLPVGHLGSGGQKTRYF